MADCLNVKSVYMCGIIGTALMSPLIIIKELINYTKFLI